MDCNACPEEVEWRKVVFKPLFSIMEHVSFQPGGCLVVPNHLDQDDIRQFSIIIDYRQDVTEEEIDRALRDSGISWDSMNYNKRRIWGGSVFKLPGKNGHWETTVV